MRYNMWYYLGWIRLFRINLQKGCMIISYISSSFSCFERGFKIRTWYCLISCTWNKVPVSRSLFTVLSFLVVYFKLYFKKRCGNIPKTFILINTFVQNKTNDIKSSKAEEYPATVVYDVTSDVNNVLWRLRKVLGHRRWASPSGTAYTPTSALYIHVCCWSALFFYLTLKSLRKISVRMRVWVIITQL